MPAWQTRVTNVFDEMTQARPGLTGTGETDRTLKEKRQWIKRTMDEITERQDPDSGVGDRVWMLFEDDSGSLRSRRGSDVPLATPANFIKVSTKVDWLMITGQAGASVGISPSAL